MNAKAHRHIQRASELLYGTSVPMFGGTLDAKQSSSKAVRAAYAKIWKDHPFEFKDTIGIPDSVNVVDVGVMSRCFLEIVVNNLKFAFLINPGDKHTLVQDLNESVRDFVPDIEPNWQIATGTESKSCIQMCILPGHWHGQDAIKVNFLKSADICELFTKGECKAADTLMLLVFAYAQKINFEGVIVLDDDMRYRGNSVFMHRLKNGLKPFSKYEEYGFAVSECNKAAYEAMLEHAIKNKSFTTNVSVEFEKLLKSMCNSNWKRSLKRLNDKVRRCKEGDSAGAEVVDLTGA